MIHRRGFLQSALAAAVLPSLSVPAANAGTMPLYKVIYDGRFPAGLAFAMQIRQTGAPLCEVQGNVAQLWSEDLYGRWRKSAAPIAGLTDHHAWFLLDMMARDAGMRTVYRADHQTLPDGRAHHRLFGLHAPHTGLLLSDATAQADWARTAADIVCSFPRDLATLRRAPATMSIARRQSIAHGTLLSWVIASPPA
jgi:hypothetical protein